MSAALQRSCGLASVSGARGVASGARGRASVSHCSVPARLGAGRPRVHTWAAAEEAATTDDSDTAWKQLEAALEWAHSNAPATAEELAWVPHDPAMRKAYVSTLQDMFDVPGLISVQEGVDGLPKVVLTHPPSGHTAEIYLKGATVLSWRNASGQEYLQDGGASVIFPQHGSGPLPTHGFASRMHWDLVEVSWDAEEGAADPQPAVTLQLRSDKETEAVYDAEWTAQLRIRLTAPDNGGAASDITEGQSFKGDDDLAEIEDGVNAQSISESPAVQLGWELTVANTGEAPMSFTAGLPVELAVEDLSLLSDQVRAVGLMDKYFLELGEDARSPVVRVDDRYFATVPHPSEGAQQRVYVDSDAGDVLFTPGMPYHFELQLREGFRDVLFGNAASAAPESEYAAHTAVVGAAAAAREVKLEAGDAWNGHFVLRRREGYWQKGIDELASTTVAPPLPTRL